MSQEIPVHPAALLFPMMVPEDLGNLADDIAANGLMEPVVLYHGQVLDGRNRLAACEMASIEPRFVEVDGELPSATIYVLSKNLHRRHLTTSQRAAVAAEVVPLLQEEAHSRQLSGLKNQQHTSSALKRADDNHGKTSVLAAKAMQVGSTAVDKALQVKREAPEVFEQVKRGEVNLHAANRALPSKRKADPGAAYEPKTDHQKKRAVIQKERMISALSNVTGLCRGLADELDLPMALSVCSKEDRDMVIDRAHESAKHLRAFIAKIERTDNA